MANELLDKAEAALDKARALNPAVDASWHHAVRAAEVQALVSIAASLDRLAAKHGGPAPTRPAAADAAYVQVDDYPGIGKQRTGQGPATKKQRRAREARTALVAATELAERLERIRARRRANRKRP